MENQWSKFSQKIKIKASKQEVYNAWASQQALEKWFLRLAKFTGPDGKPKNPDQKIAKGDTYLWRWYGHPDSVQEKGAILEANGNDMVKFSFGKAGNVTVKMTDDKDNTLLEIVQDEIPTDEESKHNFHVGCQTGWTFFRANLKSILEGGIDLRNKGSNEDLID